MNLRARVDWRWILLGWSRADVRSALVMAMSACVTLALAVSGLAAFQPSLGCVLMPVAVVILFSRTSGESIFIFFVYCIGCLVFVAPLVALIITAMGAHSEPSVSKAAIVICLVTLVSVITHYVRIRFPIWDVGGRCVQLFVSFAPFLVYYSNTKSTFDIYIVSITVPSYWALGAGILVLVLTSLVPSYSGRSTRQLLQNLLDKVLQQQEAVTDLLAQPLDPKTGLLSKAVDNKGTVKQHPEYDGVALGISEEVLSLYANFQVLASTQSAIVRMLVMSRWEVDVYKKPHIFPTDLYHKLSWKMRIFDHQIMSLFYSAQDGMLPLRCLAVLMPQIKELVGATKATSAALCQLIANNNDGEMIGIAKEEADALKMQIYEIRAMCVKLTDDMLEMGANPPPDTTPEELAVAELAVEYYILLARQIRDMYYYLYPGACSEADHKWPSQLATLYFQNQAVSGGNTRPLPTVEDVAIVHAHQNKQHGMDLCFSVLDSRFGLTKHCLALMLQNGVAIAVSSLLITIPGFNNDFMLGGGVTIIISVVLTAEVQVGGCIDRVIQRFFGTCLAAVLCAFAAACAYLASGLVYNPTDAGIAVGTLILGIWMTFCAAIQSRMFPRAYSLWQVAALTPCLTVLPIFGDKDEWESIALKVLAVTIGISINSAAQMLLFPVTSKTWLKVKTLSGLEQVAQLIEDITGKLRANDLDQAAINDTMLDGMLQPIRKTLIAIQALQQYAAYETSIFRDRSLSPIEIRQFMNKLRFTAACWVFTALTWEPLVEHGAWSLAEGKAWGHLIDLFGAQEAACLRALKQIIEGTTSMEEALVTVRALEQLVLKVAVELKVDIASLQGFTEMTLLSSPGLCQQGHAVLVLRAGVSAVFTMHRLYKVTAQMLLTDSDLKLAHAELERSTWWKNAAGLSEV